MRVGADTQLPGLVSVDRTATTTDPVAVTVPVLLQLFAAAMPSRVAGMDLMAASGGESPRAVRMEDARPPPSISTGSIVASSRPPSRITLTVALRSPPPTDNDEPCMAPPWE